MKNKNEVLRKIIIAELGKLPVKKYSGYAHYSDIVKVFNKVLSAYNNQNPDKTIEQFKEYITVLDAGPAFIHGPVVYLNDVLEFLKTRPH